MTSAVLVLTNEQDIGADYLIRELTSRDAQVVRLNSERGPGWRMNLIPGRRWSLKGAGRELTSSGCRGVWWRRPEAPQAAWHESESAEAVADQWRAFLGALATVPGPVWISLPDRIGVAESKALQLRRASEAGLSVPQTLWTNDLAEAQHFVTACEGAVVVKSVATAWWESRGGDSHFVFSSVASQDDLPDTESLALAPVCLQQPIRPKRDVRATVIDTRVFAAIRERPARDEPLDWRLAEQRSWSPYSLPVDVERACLLIVRSLDLRFAGIDLAVDSDNRHWFLELNPNGEWGWLQDCGLPIAEALSDALLSKDEL